MSAAWLLSRQHDVTVYERKNRTGGHSNTVIVDGSDGPMPVDTGFIVYNTSAYPNLTALFCHLDVATDPTDMSLGISLRDGALEYSGTTLTGLLAQPANIVRPAFWGMLLDVGRFYKSAPDDAPHLADDVTLGEYLVQRQYGRAFIHDHLLPMAAAIWSAPAETMLNYPMRAFVGFCENHGLLLLSGRPVWRTVTGGSRSYVEKLTRAYSHRIRTSCGAVSIARRAEGGVTLADTLGIHEHYDHVVLACHADEALALLTDATDDERRVLSAFHYTTNTAVLHSDARLMPRRKAVWSSWNYIGRQDDISVTYWMNRLQNLTGPVPYFVTLNPVDEPARSLTHYSETYTHPIFDPPALAAQRRLWSLQGVRHTWFCGAYFGSGFHEDGLQAGLAVGEALGGVLRPWSLPDASSRIFVSPLSRATPVQLHTPEVHA